MNVYAGNGFITDGPTISSTGISDPNPFFTELMGRPYLNNVVISPHIYGKSIAHITNFQGAALYDAINLSVGYLNKKGYCNSAGICHVFPIVVGETGSALTDPDDLLFYESLNNYFKNIGDAQDSVHDPIDSVYWWSWNANSGARFYLFYSLYLIAFTTYLNQGRTWCINC